VEWIAVVVFFALLSVRPFFLRNRVNPDPTRRRIYGSSRSKTHKAEPQQSRANYDSLMNYRLVFWLGAAVSVFGFWFWATENAYARENDNELASVLQWVGVSQALTGVALVVIALKAMKTEQADEEGTKKS
jgi:hypothetical protein